MLSILGFIYDNGMNNRAVVLAFPIEFMMGICGQVLENSTTRPV